MVVGWRWGYDIYVVMLYQHLVSLVHRTGCLHVTVVQGIEVDVYDRALLSVLLVVYPADYRTEIVECNLVDKSVLAMEWDGLRIVLMEEVEGVDHRICITEETINTFLFLGSDILEASLGEVAVFLDKTFGNHQFVHSILSRVLEFLLAGHAAHRIAHLESWVYEDAVESFQQLGVHSAHRSTDDEVRLFCLCHLLQHLYGFFRMYRNVLSYESGVRHQLLQHLHGAALSRREETVNIHDFLARHEVGELLDIWIHNLIIFIGGNSLTSFTPSYFRCKITVNCRQNKIIGR